MHTSTDLSSAISEFQEQQFSILIVGPRGILSEEKQIWSKKEMLHFFHVHIYLAPDNVSVGVAFPPFLIPFPPGLYKHSLWPEGDLNLKGAGIFVQKLKLNPDVTNLGISQLFLDSKKIPFYNKQPNKSMVTFHSDKDVFVEYFSLIFFLQPQL